MAFNGWPAEAIDFYEALLSDNSRAYWQAHRQVYDRSVKGPMEELLTELAPEFGHGRLFRPNRDVRFSADKSPYRLNCGAHLGAGYISFSADGLMVGAGLYMPAPPELQRYRAAVDDVASGSELATIVADLRRRHYEIGASEVLASAPRGFAKNHPRIELLRLKGIVMSKSWPAGPWLATAEAKDRVVSCLTAAGPLNVWLERNVG